jgi:hypothetical protein
MQHRLTQRRERVLRQALREPREQPIRQAVADRRRDRARIDLRAAPGDFRKSRLDRSGAGLREMRVEAAVPKHVEYALGEFAPVAPAHLGMIGEESPENGIGRRIERQHPRQRLLDQRRLRAARGPCPPRPAARPRAPLARTRGVPAADSVGTIAGFPGALAARAASALHVDACVCDAARQSST